MRVIYLLLYLIACICFAVAAFRGEEATHRTRRVNLIALGLLSWVLVPTLRHIDSLD